MNARDLQRLKQLLLAKLATKETAIRRRDFGFPLGHIAHLSSASFLRYCSCIRMKTANNIARFRGGANRRDLKPRFDLIPFEFLESVARVLSSGAVRYGPYNWKRGQKDFFLDAWNHAFVHLERFKEGDASEDHLAHMASNVAFLVWAVKNGVVAQDDFRCPM